MVFEKTNIFNLDSCAEIFIVKKKQRSGNTKCLRFILGGLVSFFEGNYNKKVIQTTKTIKKSSFFKAYP